MSYQPIEDYGIIGNMHTVALIGKNGAIDWFCFPYIDSPSVFGALLDDEKGGSFVIQPHDNFNSVAEYLPRTNILITRFRTRTGIMKLTDFMLVPAEDQEETGNKRHILYRLIELEQGEMEVLVRFAPRFNYGRSDTSFRTIDNGFMAESEDRSLALITTRELEKHDKNIGAIWHLAAGDKVSLRAGSNIADGQCGTEDFKPTDIAAAEKDLSKTREFWHKWLDRNETGRNFSYSLYQEMVERSALVLKLLYFEPTGTIAAAGTTSLPEELGGIRNWDYRFTWVRDAAFALDALFNLGHLSEMEGYFRWLDSLLSESGPEKLRVMYGLSGEAHLREIELNHLNGYKGSKPVRIGNSAARQRQMDIYGELMDTALKLSDYVGKIKAEQWPALQKICDYVVNHWHEKDSGIWEVRGAQRDFVYSKIMCWVALDRGITIARRYGFPADFARWEETRSAIHNQVCEKGFNQEIQAFVQSYGSDQMDSSNLLIPILGFLPFDDPRIISTVDAITDALSRKGLLYRYQGEDGLQGEEGAFLLCSFWLVECLVRMGRHTEAEALLHRLEGTANHLGLFSEEYDARWKEALGNFPQAFTHIGYVKSVISILEARETRNRTRQIEKDSEFSLRAFKQSALKLLPFSMPVLNEGKPGQTFSPGELASVLKSRMNLLRGAFFDTVKGRVAYERMRGSDIYLEYVEAARSLREFDPRILETREEKIAFWLNLYNVVVIHGVVEMGIKDSVREVTRFFRRIRYCIGGNYYTPDDIEHGILRANRRPPNALFRLFGRNDPRLPFSLEKEDPRIHFALVCASSSCPPIDLYTSENIDQELDQAARSFLNGGGLVLKKRRMEVSLSRIFKWYKKDFGNSKTDLLCQLADYLYESESGNFLKEHRKKLTIRYQQYDWRLNRKNQG